MDLFDHGQRIGARAGETVRASLEAGVRAARRLPLTEHVVGQEPRLPLDGRVVFITGAARGLGAELARQAYAEGASVALVGRTPATLEALAAELGERAAAFPADVTDLAALERAARATVDRFGSIDAVIANAGVAAPSESLLTIDPKEFERTVDIDLLGQWRTIRATLPAIIESGGHILVVASIYAFVNGMLNASYAASKAGVEQLVRAARVELAEHGATAGLAYLGFIDTELISDAYASDHIDLARKTVPGWFTDPMPIGDAASAVLHGVVHRRARVTAPRWVRPALLTRGLSTTIMDEVMLGHRGIRRAIAAQEDAARDAR